MVWAALVDKGEKAIERKNGWKKILKDSVISDTRFRSPSFAKKMDS